MSENFPKHVFFSSHRSGLYSFIQLCEEHCVTVRHIARFWRLFHSFACSSFLQFFISFLSGDAHARRPLHKMDGVFFFFSFCRSVVGTSGLAPSPTSGPLILPVFGRIWEIVFTYFANFEHSRRVFRLHLVDFGKEVLRFLNNSVSIAVFSAEAN